MIHKCEECKDKCLLGLVKEKLKEKEENNG